MELVINPETLFANCDADHMSGSVAELGEIAGKFTWNNCLQAAKDHASLFSGIDYDALRDHFREYGAWDQEEIEGWTKLELRAMAIQEIAADYRYQTEHGATDVRHELNKEDGLIYCYFGC